MLGGGELEPQGILETIKATDLILQNPGGNASAHCSFLLLTLLPSMPLLTMLLTPQMCNILITHFSLSVADMYQGRSQVPSR
jgi:hypothetical protein